MCILYKSQFVFYVPKLLFRFEIFWRTPQWSLTLQVEVSWSTSVHMFEIVDFMIKKIRAPESNAYFDVDAEEMRKLMWTHIWRAAFTFGGKKCAKRDCISMGTNLETLFADFQSCGSTWQSLQVRHLPESCQLYVCLAVKPDPHGLMNIYTNINSISEEGFT